MVNIITYNNKDNMELEREYLITTDQGGFVELSDNGKKPYCCVTSVERVQHYKLSEAVAVKENYKSFWALNGCKIHKIELVVGEQINI